VNYQGKCAGFIFCAADQDHTLYLYKAAMRANLKYIHPSSQSGVEKMFGSQLRGARAYEETGVETGVMNADSHELVAMLFEGARFAIGKAMFALEQEDWAAKGFNIGRAISIISEGLNQSLIWDADPQMADRLSSLYEYMQFRLTQANIHNDRSQLLEVDRLLGELESAWKAIAPKRRQKPVGLQSLRTATV
jgi:flagellar secretion chaperone FliS